MSHLIDALSEKAQKNASKTSMPDWMDPMLARLTHDYFSGEDWIFERKLDGERVLTYILDDGQIQLKSRNKKNLNLSYPEIKNALSKNNLSGFILDGEVVALNEDHVSDFQKLQPRMQVTSRKEAIQSDIRVFYYLFDCLYADGYDITDCPLRDRKKLLRKAIEYKDPIRFVQHRNDDGLKFYQEACEKGWEGLIAKQAESSYVHSRSGKWLKFKCIRQQEFVIGGFTEPHGERIGFGALLLGYYHEGDLIYAGKVGTGFDDDTLKSLRNRLDDLRRKTSPFDRGDPETNEVHFVIPKLVCEIAFSEWTEADHLRHPRFKGLRRDKAAQDVHKEQESQAAQIDEGKDEN